MAVRFNPGTPTVESKPKKTRQGNGKHSKYSATSRNQKGKSYRGQGKQSMRIQIWYSEHVQQWRWSLYTRKYAKNGDATHLTGSAPKIRDAMEDVSNRVEYLTKQYI